MTSSAVNRRTRLGLADASVVTICALAAATAYIMVAAADRARPRGGGNVPAVVEAAPVAGSARAVAARAPAKGLVPAAPTRRRVIVVRRSRAS